MTNRNVARIVSFVIEAMLVFVALVAMVKDLLFGASTDDLVRACLAMLFALFLQVTTTDAWR